MKRLNKMQIEVLKQFVDTFDLDIVYNGEHITLDYAMSILEGNLPSNLTFQQRKDMFIETMKPFLGEYDREMLNKFYRYWCKEEGTKLKFELQDSWKISQRLSNWKRNDEEYKRKQYIEQLNRKI